MGSYLSAEWNSKSWQNLNFFSVCYTTLVFLRSLGVSCGSLLAQQQLVTEHVITAISAKEEKDSHGKINDCCRKQLGWAQYALISYWQECLNIVGVFFYSKADQCRGSSLFLIFSRASATPSPLYSILMNERFVPWTALALDS